MSMHCWKEGTIVLPAAEATRVRRALIERNNQIADEALAAAKDVWAVAGSTRKKNGFELIRLLSARHGGADNFGNVFRSTAVTERAAEILQANFTDRAPRTPLKKNAGHLKLSETRIRDSYGDETVTFDGRVLTYSFDGSTTYGGSWIEKALLTALAGVRWTRGTGGTINGNDEAHMESREYGSGANYCWKAFGPLGRREAPMHTEAYMTSSGQFVSRDTLRREAIAQGRW